MSYQSADSPIDVKVKFSNPYNRAVFNTVSFKYEPATLEFSGFFFDLNRKNEKVVVFNFETNTYQPVQFKNGKIMYTADEVRTDEDVSSSFTTRELNGETWRNETAINTKQGLIFMIDGEYEALNNETQQYEKVIVKNGKVIKKAIEEVKLAEIKSTKSEPEKAEAVVQQKTRAKEEGQKRDETKEVVEFKKETESRKETPKQQPTELKNKDPELTKDKSNKALEVKKSEPKPSEKQPEQKQDQQDQKSTQKLQEKSQLEKEPKTPKQQQKQFKLQNEPEIKREESNKKEVPVFLNREPAIQSDYVINGAVETRKGKMLSLEIDQKLQLVVNQRTKEFDQIAIQQGLVYLLNANMLPTPIPMQRPEETPKQFLTNDIQIEFCSELIEEQTEECEEMNEMEVLQEEVEELKTRLSLTEEKVQQQEKEINELKKMVRELMKTK
ncbi:Hypothetical_protein [Hexamita inflata]|uniref:Hypothetical_protein n=1 Tax=Hexamita inflata TaxID=28002 RepID=A0AA86U9G3_9EUKA|nr:Hypothetical protein HINF_LOCUS36345 [Hexamita inflata]